MAIKSRGLRSVYEWVGDDFTALPFERLILGRINIAGRNFAVVPSPTLPTRFILLIFKDVICDTYRTVRPLYGGFGLVAPPKLL